MHILTINEAYQFWCNLLQAFTKGIDKEMVCLMAARASRMENQDAIDAAIVGCLADPKEVCISFISQDCGFYEQTEFECLFVASEDCGFSMKILSFECLFVAKG